MNESDRKLDDILVSIHCITYNQKKYIRQCLDGFIMQKTNFKFVAYVGDDCSSDGTREIIEEYEQKYPHIIKGIYHTQNTSGIANYFDVANACKSKYVAFCEGDDYWTDEKKLQKQVNFLESHSDYSVCFHPVKIVYEDFDFDKPIEIYPKNMVEKELTFAKLLNENFIHTNSVMYRWEFNEKIIEDHFPNNILPGDWYMHLLHAKQGKIKCLADIMSVYRRNPSGIWSDSINNIDNLHLKYGLQEINFSYSVYKNIADSSPAYLEDIFLPKFKKIADVYYFYKKFKELEEINEKYSNYFDKALKLTKNKTDEKNIKLERKYKKYKRLFNLTLFILFIVLLYIFFERAIIF